MVVQGLKPAAHVYDGCRPSRGTLLVLFKIIHSNKLVLQKSKEPLPTLHATANPKLCLHNGLL